MILSQHNNSLYNWPNATLIEKCRVNLRDGYYPVIITIFDRVRTALDLAADAGLDKRVEVWDVRSFVFKYFERSRFDEANHSTIADIIEKYNEIVRADPILAYVLDGKAQY